MKREELNVSIRHTLGKKVRSLRREGITPANLYGPSIQSIPLQVETHLFERLIARMGRNAVVTLRVDGDKPKLAMIRDIKRDPLNDRLLHVDFFRVDVKQKVRAEISIHLVGEALAAKSRRGMLMQELNTLHIEGLPIDLPRAIELDISQLVDIDQAIHVRDIDLGDKLESINDPQQIVVHVVASRIEAEVKAVEAAPTEEEAETE